MKNERLTAARNEENPAASERAQWLGAEAHVRYQGKHPGWREWLRPGGPAFAGLALGAAFLAGALMGSAAILFSQPRQPSKMPNAED
ncbi:MAG: hypothetical protein ACREI3_05565 [Nitrospirales bacterium]